jgi:hypothetical protein
MLLSRQHVFSARKLQVEALKEHVAARHKVVDNALATNMRFGPENIIIDVLQNVPWLTNPEGYFWDHNNLETSVGCTAAAILIMQSGNHWEGSTDLGDMRHYDGIWVPGDLGYIINGKFEDNSLDPVHRGENVFHTDAAPGVDYFWGHWGNGKHSSLSESEWFARVRDWNTREPTWKDEIFYPHPGLSNRKL